MRFSPFPRHTVAPLSPAATSTVASPGAAGATVAPLVHATSAVAPPARAGAAVASPGLTAGSRGFSAERGA
ncbi:hypothetical protein GCM10010517_35870 [Streptosporangium fragile]|uniref:Uncharacterized protein n=1 Tax=Streptosporangium fragile TaxID=46186 RepID=A0ABP6II73_9ACTN